MVKYNAKVIYTFAQRLYRSAQIVMVLYTLIGGLGGGIAGGLLSGEFGIVVLFSAVVGGVIGWFLGTQRAFHLKLQAQVALCQAKIEENTRPNQETPALDRLD